jgi:integrase
MKGGGSGIPEWYAERRRITQTIVKASPPPEKGERFLRDAELRGFALRVTAAGVKSFVLEIRVYGKLKRMTIGRWPDWTADAARNEAEDWRYRAKRQGVDPRPKKAVPQPEPLTLAKAIAGWRGTRGKGMSARWLRDTKRFEQYMPEQWLKTTVVELRRSDMERLHAHIAVQGIRAAEVPLPAALEPRTEDDEQPPYAVTANKIIKWLRTVLRCNAVREQLPAGWDNPCSGITWYPETSRTRFLNEDEVARFQAALQQEPDWRWRLYWTFALSLGLRRGTLTQLQWDWVRFSEDEQRAVLFLPARSLKNREPLAVPVPAALLPMLHEAPSRGKSPWVFPSWGKKSGHLTEVKSAWARICKAAKISAATPHDLRRTLGSWATGARYPDLTVQRILGHQSLESTKIYARLDLEPLTKALEHINGLMFPNGPPSLYLRIDPKQQKTEPKEKKGETNVC